MVVYGVYIGYGINIKYIKLAEILGQYGFQKNKCNSDPEDSDDSSENDNGYDSDYVYKMNDFLNENKIFLSNTKSPIKLLQYPHTEDEYCDETVALGIFEYIRANSDKKDEKQLRHLLVEKIDFDEFESMFGKKPKFMTILDDCRCCN